MSTDLEVFARRLQLVLALGDANAARHRAQAMAGGAEIEVLTEERGDAAGLPKARARDAAAEDRLAAASARVEALEAELAAIDDLLARAAR